MRRWNIVLANLIRRGQVTVDIPGLDMDRLEEAIHDQSQELLRRVAGVVYNDEWEGDDSDKIRQLRELLKEI